MNIQRYLLSLMAITAIAAALAGCKKNYAEQNNTAETFHRRVKTERLEPVTEPVPIFGTGLLASAQEMNLSFKIGGIVKQINSDEGQRVRKGQVLASLDLTEINAQVTQARQQADKAARDLKRLEALHADKVITLEQLQDATTAYEVAKAQLQQATFNQRYAQIIAPESGRILRRHMDRGELASPGQPVFELAAEGAQAWIIRLGLADRDVVQLLPGDTAKIAFDAYPGETFTARITEIGEAADPRTGTYEVELTLEPTDRTFKNGFVAKIEIYPGKTAPYYRIPINAVVQGDGLTAEIFLARQKVVHKQQVTARLLTAGYLNVPAQYLPQGAEVVVSSVAYLKEGDTIEVENR